MQRTSGQYPTKLKKIAKRLPFEKCLSCSDYSVFKAYEPEKVGWFKWCYTCGFRIKVKRSW